ncbi:GNAT family N-acetyltransferase [Bizionia gelidisalsuginis]|uniref:GNAT family N-acetyltransferase n=1 Tax=Bizionia gelidisalsuginis TaxID=291188 RepID=UPI001FE6360A|nr:GNAT family N-acetyltransferase [Bizionia gelidisalsuginis]
MIIVEKMKFKPYPEIKSERLFLRQIKESDAKAILFLRSDKTVNTFIERPENRKTKNISDALEFIKEVDNNIESNQSIAWGITFISDPKLIGTICLWNFSQDNTTAEVGYDLNPKFQNKGIMSEALKKIIEYGFKDLNLDKIEAFTHIENENSKKLLVKNGFHFNENRKDLNNKSNIIFEIENVRH